MVNWDTLCKPKRIGGLGLKKIALQNEALLMKLGWRLFKDNHEVWAHLLHCKYINKRRGFSVQAKQGDSRIWRSIVSVWPNMMKGICWSLGNGERCEFWKDKWLELPLPLENYASPSVPIVAH